MSIVIEDLTKRYGEHPVVNAVSLEIGDGELFVLLGSSGSGKSTLQHCGVPPKSPSTAGGPSSRRRVFPAAWNPAPVGLAGYGGSSNPRCRHQSTRSRSLCTRL